ncbi:DNA integrase/recombinase [Streptomyces sp. NBC_01017]|nr:DNA integrase/recombinase [Streptomyces sp. NBC_01017]
MPLVEGQGRPSEPLWQTEEPREKALERTLALPFTADTDTNQRTRRRGLIKLLDWLEDQPGRTWQERWTASGAEEAGREWPRVPMQWLAEHQRARKYDRADLCCGMIPLLGGQVARPAYRWLLRQRPSQLLAHIRSVTDPDGFAALKDQFTATGHAGANDCNNALNRVTWIVTCKDGTIRDVTIGDCVELQHAIGEHQTNGYHGKHLFYQLLAGLGVFGPRGPRPAEDRDAARTVSTGGPGRPAGHRLHPDTRPPGRLPHRARGGRRLHHARGHGPLVGRTVLA